FATGDSRTSAELRWLYATPVWPIDPMAELDHVAWSCAEVARGGFDVVHVNQATALTLMRFVRVPFVYTLHHDRVEELSRFYSRLPDVHYVAISERQRQLEIPLPHVEVVHHGIDPAAFPFVAEPDDYVAFISRFAPTKAPHLAIDAAQRAGVPIRLAGCPRAAALDRRRCRARACERFTATRMVRDYLRVYEAAARRRHQARELRIRVEPAVKVRADVVGK